METINKTPVTFTPSAAQEIKRLMNQESNNGKFLRIGVKGGGCSGLSYVLGFEPKKENDNDYVFEGLPFVIDKAHELYLATSHPGYAF